MIIESDNLTLYQQYWQRQNTDYSYQTSEKDYVDQRLSALVYTYGKTEKKNKKITTIKQVTRTYIENFLTVLYILIFIYENIYCIRVKIL